MQTNCRGKKNPETQAHLYIKGRREENTYTIACMTPKNFWKNFKVNTFISEKCDQRIEEQTGNFYFGLWPFIKLLFFFYHDPTPYTTPWKDLRSKTFLPWSSSYIEDPGQGGEGRRGAEAFSWPLTKYQPKMNSSQRTVYPTSSQRWVSKVCLPSKENLME